MPEINLNDEVKKRHIVKPIEVFDPDTIDWQCPFCAPPALSFKLPPKDEPAKREQVKVIISAHLQQHRQDLLQALNERTKGKMKIGEDRTRASLLWIDSTIPDYAAFYDC
ncbi:hypothetical protein O0I10_006806 [Lichtheimia ornata]|uniref:Uncharacterized protein n=1 Tax=Lichtheimia ornata TaxID=688661 RepID=A0AAD7V1D3_9FUNG|nr:uncharacterized protein O0I10_006806 [Lichtheimia ornata]KAJ8657504.1 hypothetical protein O0I10_006806 [Lichtheimia ornata]